MSAVDLETFLQLRGAVLPAVVSAVQAKVGLTDDDVLLAVGSLVEGLGTPKSDLDLMLITPRDPATLPAEDHVTLVVARCLIDMRVLRIAALDELSARFARWLATPWNVTHALKFSVDDRTLLHRIRNGRVLHRDRGDRILSRLPQQPDLARLKLHVARQTARTIQVDMVGNRESHDYRSLVTAGQELLGHAIDALAAGHGLTNPLLKWRSRMLEALPSDWERGLVLRPTGRSAADHVWLLHRAPEHPDEASAVAHAFGITTFTRAVFHGAERQLVAGVEDSPLAAWRTSRARDAALPYLDFDVDFLVGPDGSAMARLNEFAAPVELTAQELALALLFDGRTTRREAAAAVLADDPGGADVVRGLAARLTGAGLCVAAPR